MGATGVPSTDLSAMRAEAPKLASPATPLLAPSIPSKWAIAVLLALTVAWHGKLLLGYLPISTDNLMFYGPLFQQTWDDGPPLWNRFQGSGSPLIDNLQAAPWYPPRWPFYVLADWRTYYGPFMFLHQALATIGAWWWIRCAGLSGWAAVVGGAMYGLGGHMTGRAINPTIFFGSCWLPVLLAGACGMSRAHRRSTVLGWWMIAATGSPHLLFYGGVGWGLTLLCVGLHGLPDWRAWWRAAWIQGGHMGLGLAIGGPTVIAALARLPLSLREETTVATNLQGSLGWNEIVRGLLGGTGGNVYPEFIDKCMYIGPIAAVLLVTEALRRCSWRQPAWRASVALIVAGLWLALGSNAGVQYVMGAIPGFSMLAGPARALILVAAGTALGVACGIARLADDPPRRSHRRVGVALAGFLLGMWVFVRFLGRITGDDAPSLWDWFHAWLREPSAVLPQMIAAMEAIVWLPMLAATWMWSTGQPRARVVGTSALLILTLFHFASRAGLPSRPPESMDPATKPALLAAKARESFAAGEPFRVVGLDALRINAYDHSELHMREFLTPNVAGLAGLEDIQGFDPLTYRSYRDLCHRLAGRAAYSDPLRSLEIARPDETLFQLLNVRYLVGHPRDLALTNLPIAMHPQGERTARVAEWTADRQNKAIERWSFVGLADFTRGMPRGTVVAVLHLQTVEGPRSFYLRLGHEIADISATNPWAGLGGQGEGLPGHARWTAFNPQRPDGSWRVLQQTWRGYVEFGEPLHVVAAGFELAAPCLVQISSQAVRLARTPSFNETWRLAIGSEHEVAPVWEYLPWQPRAVFLADERVAEDQSAARLTIDESALATPPLNKVIQSIRVRTNSLQVSAEAEADGWILFREIWTPGWKATLDGAATAVYRVNDVFRGVRLPKGAHTIEMVYRPTRALLALGFSSMLALCWLMWEWRRRKEPS